MSIWSVAGFELATLWSQTRCATRRATRRRLYVFCFALQVFLHSGKTNTFVHLYKIAGRLPARLSSLYASVCGKCLAQQNVHFCHAANHRPTFYYARVRTRYHASHCACSMPEPCTIRDDFNALVGAQQINHYTIVLQACPRPAFCQTHPSALHAPVRRRIRYDQDKRDSRFTAISAVCCFSTLSMRCTNHPRAPFAEHGFDLHFEGQPMAQQCV